MIFPKERSMWTIRCFSPVDMKKIYLILILVHQALLVLGQEDSTDNDRLAKMVNLSEVVIRSDLNIATFIRRVKEDSSFYKAFRNLHLVGFTSLIECILETGRTHQIRVHMKHIGHPLFNDDFYGGDKIVKGTVYTKYKQFVDNCFSICPRQALHAKTLGFIHPTTGKEMYFDTELPADISNVIDKWRKYVNVKK